jgi:hypothetical protein
MTFGEDPGGAGCSVEESEKIFDTYPPLLQSDVCY